MKNLLPVAVIVSLFLLSAAMTLSLRIDPFLPNHGDEWDLLIYVREMQENQKPVFFDPTNNSPLSGPHYWLEMNYHLLVFSFLNLSAIDLLLSPLVFTLVTSFLMLASVFVLVRDFTKSSLAGLIASVFVLGLKNNIALLGYNFMVPMAFGLAMVPLLLYSFLLGVNSNRHFLVFSLLTLNTFFTHPVYAVLMVPVTIVFFAFRPRLLLKNFFRVFALAVIVFVSGILAVRHLVQGNFSTALVDLFVFPIDQYIGFYPLLGFVGTVDFVFAVLGLLVLVLFALPRPSAVRNAAEKTSFFLGTSFSPSFRFALFSTVFVLVWLYIRFYSDTNRVCFFGPCRRTSTGFILPLLMVAGIGLFFVSKIVLEIVFKGHSKWVSRAFTVVSAFLLSFVLLAYVFASAFTYKADFYSAVSREQLPHLEWLKQQNVSGTVFSPDLVPKAVFLVAEKSVPAMERARLGDFAIQFVEFNPNFSASASREKDRAQEIGFFELRDCENQKAIIKKYNISLAYWKNNSSCLKSDRVFAGGQWHVSKFIE